MQKNLAAILLSCVIACPAFANPIQEAQRDMQATMKDDKVLEFKSTALVTNSVKDTYVCGEVRVIEADGKMNEFIPFAYANPQAIFYLYPGLPKGERSDYRLTGCEGLDKEASWRNALELLNTNCSANWSVLSTYYIDDKSEDEAVAAGLKVIREYMASGNKPPLAEDFDEVTEEYLRDVLDMAREAPDMEESIKKDPKEAQKALMSICWVNFIEKSFDEH
ncbi:hypothetical protein [Enterobacillus tribolii]|uniref:Uncharacterized protein n=1 Tax=Enterobacillus tribolii TaxID=1487935 RepID=A0A370R3S3_9GAMM|nr:hypothetical protein [Enterobacillus tribolii]MBW7984342.1 hypothetical protein [Enterobacillus tribolii]RDK97080.1 hypothetical protein C8D90_101524 [Enterobacillus tribolii]